MKENELFNVDFYTRSLLEHGDTFKALNWGSKESQLKRFKILSEIGELRSQKVLDVGCGLGDFWSWSQERGFNLRYKGIDITPLMVQQAAAKYPNVDFEVLSIMDTESLHSQFDYVVASGIFTYCLTDSYTYVESFLGHMVKIATKGVAVNMLSKMSTRQDEGEFYADPGEIVRIAGHLTRRFTIRHDYHSGDFTLYLYR